MSAATGSPTNHMMYLHQALAWLPGARAVGDLGVAISRVHSDSRSVQAGDLFVALKGERFDANRFLSQARDRGAAAALCHPGAGLRQLGMPGIEVPDTTQALGQLAAAWRARFTLALIAVTGSNGKTTVTQMLASILRAYKPAAMLATEGNLNNQIGVPLTLLRLRREHEIAVLELGMNHPGEIAPLAAMARPTVALVNNAQREHLEFMANVEAVARENGAVIAALAPSGVAVFPHDDTFTQLWRTLAGERAQITFAVQPAAPGAPAASVCGNAPVWTGDAWHVDATSVHGQLHFALHAAGKHNVRNALAATSCALAAGVPGSAITRGLEAFEPVGGRTRALPLSFDGHAVTLIDDSYNANPDSVQAALELLASLPAPRLMVLGDMAEVGEQGEQFHAQAGAMVRELGIDFLFTLGQHSRAASRACAGARHFADIASLCDAVLAELPGVASLLVKGSRFMKMEQVVRCVMQRALPAAQTTTETPCC